MSDPSGMRRAVAEVRWENDRGLVSWVGNWPVHHYWPMISSYFRDLLLPPQRRADESVVTWTWLEPINPDPLTAADFRTLRGRLQSEQQLFAENLERDGLATQGAGGQRSQVNVEELGAVMRQVVHQLISRPDVELVDYLCRTEHGLRIHSWGAARAARPRFPNTKGLEIAGRVMVGGKPAMHDVILESGDGEHLAETPSDISGVFRFPKLVPAKYRLRARSTRGTFPAHGLTVVLNRTSVTDVILADDGPITPLARGRRSVRSRSRPLPALLAGIVIVAGLAGWIWLRPHQTDTPVLAGAPAETGANTANVARTSGTIPASGDLPPSAGGASAVAIASLGATNLGHGVSAPPATFTSDGSSGGLDARDDPTTSVEEHNSQRAGVPTHAGAYAIGAGTANGTGAGIVDGTSALAAATAVGGSPGPAASSSAASATQGANSAPAPIAGGTAAATPPSAAPASSSAATTYASPQTVASSASGPAGASQPDSNPPLAHSHSPNNSIASTPAAGFQAATSIAAATGDSVQHEPDARTASRNDAITPFSPASGASVGGTLREANVPSEKETTSRTLPMERSDRAREDAPRGVSQLTPSLAAMRRPAVSLTRTVRVRISPWRVRLIEDSILPTQPLRAGQMEPVAALRERLLAEQQARLPSIFRNAEVMTGLVLELPWEPGSEPLIWRDAAGAALADSRVQGGRAEVVWTAANAPLEHPFRLRRRNGEIVAEVRIEPQSRELVLRTTEETRAWLRWVVKASPGSETDSSRLAESESRFSWRTATGGPLPPQWQTSAVGQDYQVDVPLGSTFGAVALQGCALFDRDTGWALVTELRQAADRPLGE